MATIKNTIILDDQMSTVLDNIIDRTEMLNMMLAATPDYILEMANTMGDLAGRHTKMLEPFVEMNEQMNKITEATKEQAEAIESITKVSADATKGMQDITSGALSVMQSVGLISPQFSQAVIGVNQLGRGIAVTIPKAAGLAKMLGPISLIATAVAGVIGVIQMFRQATEYEVLPGYDDLLTRSREMTRESDRLRDSLYENVKLMERMNEIGAPYDVIEYLKEQNERYQLWSSYIGLNDFNVNRDLISAAARELWEMTQGLGVYIDGYRHAQEGLLRTKDEIADATAHNYEDRYDAILNHLKNVIRPRDETNLYNAIQSLTTAYGDFDTVRLYYLENVLFGDPENRYGQLIRDAQDVAKFINNNYATLGMVQPIEIRQSLTAPLEAAYAAAAPLIPLYQHLAAAYRDVYQAADSLRGAYDVLSATRDAMANGTLISIQQFNRLRKRKRHRRGRALKPYVCMPTAA